MTNQLPLVLILSLRPNEGSLQLEDGDTVEVGTTRWFKWLEEHNSFRFESGSLKEHSFTARKHERSSGVFWYAYRKLGKKLCNAYLGKSERLTVERMLEVAGKLSHKSEPKLGNGYAQSQGAAGYALTCITVPQERQDDEPDSLAQVMRSESEIQALKDELHQLRSQLHDMAEKAGEWYDKAKECDQFGDFELGDKKIDQPSTTQIPRDATREIPNRAGLFSQALPPKKNGAGLNNTDYPLRDTDNSQSLPHFSKPCLGEVMLQERGQQLPDLEAVRDRILRSLKLGKQAPEYKRTKAALDKFIALLQQSPGS